MKEPRKLSFAQQKTVNVIAERAGERTWATEEGLDPRPLKLLQKWQMVERMRNSDGTRGIRLTEYGKIHVTDAPEPLMPLDGSSPFESPDGDLLADALAPAPANGTGSKIHLGPFPKPHVRPLTDDRAPLPEPEPRAPVVTGAEEVVHIDWNAAAVADQEEPFTPVRQPIDWDKPNLITVEVDAPTMKQLLDQAQGYQEIQAANADLPADCGDCNDCIPARVLGKLRTMNPRLGDLLDALEEVEIIRRQLNL